MASDIGTLNQYGDMRLDDLLQLREPERTTAIRAWITAGDLMDNGTVLLKTTDGKRLATEFVDRRGKQLVVDHNGRRVSRRLAFDLMLKYGPGGLYEGRDQNTGWTKMAHTRYMKQNPELAGIYGEPSFITNHLTHVLDEPVPAGIPLLDGAAGEV